MSLDVYLRSKTPVILKSTGVFIRDNGSTRELTVEEVKLRYPDSNIEENEYETDEVFHENCTYNLNKMAMQIDLYKCLWRPDELNITIAKDLIDLLREGLHKLKLEPDKYKEFNPPNGWGDYDGLVNFVENYLNACYKYPDAEVHILR